MNHTPDWTWFAALAFMLIASIYVSYKASFEKDEHGQPKKATMAL
ncbi:MAG: hypothetical protein QM533_05080 [Cytophagales bacterium]|nr:hypothetical protein [Cytophagales bacterium]